MSSEDTPELSVVLPVYRTRDLLNELYFRLTEVLKEHSYEIIFVDDGCPERSIETLEKLASNDKRVRAFAHKKNMGQSTAVITGLSHARGKYAIILDSDLQDPPEVIPELIERMKEPWAAVFAGKVGKYESGFRLFTSRFYKAILHHSGSLPKDAGLFVILTRQMIDYLLSFERPSRSILAMMTCSNMRFASFPVERKKRLTGGSSYTTRKRMSIGLSGVRWIVLYKLGLIRRNL